MFAGLCTSGLFAVSLDFSGLFLGLRLGLRDGRGMMFETVDGCLLFYALWS